MCGFSGFYCLNKEYTSNLLHWQKILNHMTRTQQHRGPDEQDTLLAPDYGLAHTRLSIIDLSTGQQPMTRMLGEQQVAIVYNGELYNSRHLRTELMALGYTLTTTSDTEIILVAYLAFGLSFVTKLEGIFAFAISDERSRTILLGRDRCGVKPLFYHWDGEELIFSSEIKGLFCHPDLHPVIGHRGLNEVLSIGPAKTPGCGVFEGIDEVLPGQLISCCGNRLRPHCYWKLTSKEHTDSYADTLARTRELVVGAIKRQMVSDVPICTFLSGGVDSSIVSAVCAEELAKKGETLTTFSFDFIGNDQYFQANAFQPSRDRPYVDIMKNYLHSDHHYLECSAQNQVELLDASVEARDLPAMADVDSSMLYFCSLVKNTNKVVLTGECADEIFGGYPWFHKKEFFQNDSAVGHTFPWTPNLAPRKLFLSDSFLEWLQMDAYVAATYETSVAKTPRLDSDNAEERRRREIAYLNLCWFMQTLLDRMDRTSMHSGLEARVPFADHSLLEYVWNVPWTMKCSHGEVKSLLRHSCKDIVPGEILFRRKSPYPKIYDPLYEALLKERLLDILSTTNAPIHAFIDAKKIRSFLEQPSDYGKPWYGQLMAGPQLMAYYLQINHWLSHYKIKVQL